MSQRPERLLFIKTPLVLMRVPEYARLFRSNPVSTFYDILLAHVNRRERSRMDGKFSKYESYVNKLGDLYEKENLLAAYFTDEQLAESMLCDVRSIRNYRDKLIDLKLIKVQTFQSGYIYVLGDRIFGNPYDNGTLGGESESFYIDGWISMAIRDKDNKTHHFADFMFKQLGNDRVKRHIEKRAEVTLVDKKRDARRTSILVEEHKSRLHNLAQEQVDSEEDAARELVSLGNYFPDYMKLVSKNPPRKTPEKPAPSAVISVPDSGPIEDIGLNLNVNTSPLRVETVSENQKVKNPTTKQESADEPYTLFFAEQGQKPTKKKEDWLKEDPNASFRRVLPTCDNPRAVIKTLREHIAAGGDKVSLERFALENHPHLKKYARWPRFALELQHQNTFGRDLSSVNKIYNALIALREDYCGAVAGGKSSSDFSIMHTMLKDVLKNYPFKQITFTITQILQDKSDLHFFLVGAENFKALPHFMRKYATVYQETQKQVTHIRKEAEAANLRKEKKESLVEKFIRENEEYLASMSPEDRAAFEKRQADKKLQEETRSRYLKGEEIHVNLPADGTK